MDFERRGKFDDTQLRDKDSGLRVWTVTGIDMDRLRQLQDAEEQAVSTAMLGPSKPQQ